MEGFSNSFAALSFGEDVSDSEISIPSPPPSPKPAKAQLPSVEDVPAKPKAQARPSSRKEDRAYGSIVGPKVWQKKGDSTPSDGQLVKGPSNNHGPGAQLQRPKGDYRDNARPHQQKQYRDNGYQQANNGRAYQQQQYRDNGNPQANNGRAYQQQQYRDNGNQQANNGRVYQQQQRPQGNNQNAGRVYKPRGDNQNANGYNRRDNGSGYQQRNVAQEKEKTEKVIVDKEGWTHVRPKKGSEGDLSRSSSRPESRENRPEESANVNSVEEVAAPAATEDLKEVPAAAATEDPKEALPVDPKKRKEEWEAKKIKEEEEEKQRELESKQITLREYEERLMEKRKALEALRTEKRRVVVDNDLKKVLVGKKKQDEALKVDVLGRELPVSEEEEKPEKEVKPEKKKAEKEEDPEKAELARKLTLGLCRYARPPVQRQEGRREGRESGEFQQQSRQGGRGEVQQQQGRQGGRGGYRQQGRAPNVCRQAEVPEAEDFKAFPDLSAATKGKN